MMRAGSSDLVAANVKSAAGAGPTPAAVTCSGVGIGYFRTSSPEELSAPGFEHHVLCLQLRDIDVRIWANGRPVHDGRLPRGAWQAHAPGDTFHAVLRTPYDLMRFVVPVDTLAQATCQLAAAPHAVEFIDPDFRVSPFLLALAEEMRFALEGVTGSSSRLYLDSLGAAFLNYLLARHSNLAASADPSRRPSRGGLAPWQVKRITGYLDDHIADDVGLTDLAAIVGMSTFHFCRAFKASTGEPPHRWRIARRIERARELLEHTDVPVTEIAAQVGYDDPTLLARAFRKALGVCPSEYRRAQRF